MSQVEELNLLRTWGFEGYAHDSEWPQVADAVIEAELSAQRFTAFWPD